MASALSSFPYHQLNKVNKVRARANKWKITQTSSKWFKLRNLDGRRRRLVRIPRLARFLRKRSKLTISRCNILWSKAFKRLKNGQSHMNDLFGGKSLFMHLYPAPFEYGHKSYSAQRRHPHQPPPS